MSSHNSFSRRTVPIWVAILILLVSYIVPPGAMAQEPGPTSARVSPLQTNPAGSQTSSRKNLDFSSVQATIAAVRPGTITLGGRLAADGRISGGTAVSILPGALLTPAMNAALWQTITGGQSLLLNLSGAATGGTARLNSNWAGSLSALVVPAGVAVNAVNFNTSHPLAVAGSANISGSLYALQTSAGVTAQLNTGKDLIVGSGGLISGSLPAGFIGTDPGKLFASQHLILNVLGNFTNSGTVTVPGNLNINVGGTLANATVNGSTAATLSAQNLNIFSSSGNVINSGLMSAVNNININTVTANTDLNVNNAGGTLQALNSINLRDSLYAGSSNLNLTGGDWLSRELNLYSGKGSVAVNVGNLTGTVNTHAGCAHIGAVTPSLHMGILDVSGDPFVYNNGGDLDLASVTFPATYLVGTASGSIYTSSEGTAIDTSSVTGNGGNVVLAAGVTATDTDGTITLARSGTGGDIYLTAGTTPLGNTAASITGINTSSSISGSNGGNVTLLAVSNSPGSNTGGHIFLPAGAQINNQGAGTGSNGNVTMVAEAGEPDAGAIKIGSIGNSNIAFGTGGGGDINIQVGTPELTGVSISDSTGVVSTPLVIISNSSGVVLKPFPVNPVQNGSIILSGDLNSPGVVAITGGKVTTMGAISGRDVFIQSGIGGTVTIGAGGTTTITDPVIAGIITLNGKLNASGSVNLTSYGTIGGSGASEISGNSVTLWSYGNTGQNSPLSLHTANLTAFSSNGSVALNNTGTVTLCTGVFANSAGTTYTVSTTADSNGNGEILIAGNVQAGSIILTATSSAQGTGGIQNSGSTGTLSAGTIRLLDTGSSTTPDALNIGSSSSTIKLHSTTIDSASSGKVWLTNSGTVNSLTSPSSGSLTVTSSGAIDIGTGGVNSTGTITLTTTDNSGSINLQNGSISSPAAVTLNTNGAGTINIATAQSISSLATVALNTTGVIGAGTIQAPQTVLASADGAFIANPQGSVDLKNYNMLTFTGKTLAILARDDIVNTSAGTTTLNFSGASGRCNLALVAGFDVLAYPITSHDGSAYALQSRLSIFPSKNNINLSNVNINTSATGSKMFAGNVLAIATGSIALGSINTSANLTNGTGGSFTAIGTGVSVGAINTSAATPGSVSISSAYPHMNGNVVFTKGNITSGSFYPGAESFGGNISLSSINAGSANIATGAAGKITQAAGSKLTCTGTLSVSSGSQSLNLSVATANLQITTTTGSAAILNTVRGTLKTSNVGGDLAVTSSSGIAVGAGQTISAGGKLDLSSTGTTAGVSIGDGAALTSRKSVKVSVGGSGSGIILGNHVSITSGVEGMSQGALSLTSGGRGGITGGEHVSLTCLGGALSLTTTSTGSRIALGSSAQLRADGGNLSISSRDAIAIAGGSLITNRTGTVAGVLSVSATNGLSIGSSTDTTELSSASSLNLTNSGSSTSKLQFGDNVKCNAVNALTVKDSNAAAGIVAGNNLELSATAGSISITASGAAGIKTGSGLTLSSAGTAGIKIGSSSATGKVSIGDGYAFSAGNGGSITVTSSAAGADSLNIGIATGGDPTSRMAAAGAIILGAAGDLNLGCGQMSAAGSAFSATSASGTATVLSTNVSARTTAGITAAKIALDGSAAIIARSGVAIKATATAAAAAGTPTLTLGKGVRLESGVLAASAPSTGVLAPGSVTSAGSLALSAAVINIGGTTAPGEGNTMISNGKDLKITATAGTMSISEGNTFQSNGGNVIILATGVLNGGSQNTFYARALITSITTTSGGGLELGSGLTSSSNISTAFGKLPSTIPAPGALGAGVVYDLNSYGVIQANLSNGGIINLNAGGSGASTLTLTRGVQVFDAVGAGASVTSDHNTFKTESLRPIAMVSAYIPDDISMGREVRSAGDRKLSAGIASEPVRIYAGNRTMFTRTLAEDMHLSSGEVFLDVSGTVHLTAGPVEVKATSGALVSVSTDGRCTFVRSCSGSGYVSTRVSGRTFVLNPGEEILVTGHKPDDLQTCASDGLARRNSRTVACGSLYVTVSDFSIISLVTNHEKLSQLHDSSIRADRRLLARLLKCAASVEVVLGNRGAYNMGRSN
jgi:fibronectin-binding autotransporter adhesin